MDTQTKTHFLICCLLQQNLILYECKLHKCRYRCTIYNWFKRKRSNIIENYFYILVKNDNLYKTENSWPLVIISLSATNCQKENIQYSNVMLQLAITSQTDKWFNISVTGLGLLSGSNSQKLLLINVLLYLHLDHLLIYLLEK